MVSGFGRDDQNTWELKKLQELRNVRETRAEGSLFLLTRATFPSVWIRPSKHGNVTTFGHVFKKNCRESSFDFRVWMV